MRKGEIIETGTHDELVAQGGVYEKLYKLQFADLDTVENA